MQPVSGVERTLSLRSVLTGLQEGDFREFTARVLAPLRPQALVITGDLADSKTSESRGQQFEEEWQVSSRSDVPDIIESSRAAAT